ncbi:DUF4097 family beta strand repeat-containing protein [Streptosporangium sp. NPDC087985]|uniref:DUF4097 family beta strand repeat-containing protein n=1 Tax=Streptosporangium sp. NPDC087985 TaxID=3366196 RepID=UPI003805FB9C
MKKNVIVAGALLGAALVLSGCRIDVDFGHRQQAVASYDVPGELTALDVHTGSGDVVVNESDRSGVRVTETLHWSGDKNDRPRTEHPVDGGTLTLRQDCSNCAVDYRVEIPKGLKATLETDSGNITLRTLTGEVNATAGSGDIAASGLGAKRLVAGTGSGDVKLTFAVVPDHVEVETGSGDATVRLPKAGYNVTAETGSGDRTVRVTNDPSSSSTVSVRTGSGNAKVLPS